MNEPTTHHYTAAILGRAAGLSARALLRHIKTAPRSVAIVEGNPTRQWALEDLPDYIIEKIRANARGIELHVFLSTAPDPWQITDAVTRRIIPLSDIDEREIIKAAKLRNVLKEIMRDRSNPILSAAESETRGLELYRREFGHPLSPRTFRAIVKRTIERDRGFENWLRLDIYLDGNPARKHAPDAVQRNTDAAQIFGPLHKTLAGFRNPLKPTHLEREALWNDMVSLFHQRVSAGHGEKETRVSLVNFLSQAAPWFCRSKNALRVSFAKYLARAEADEPFRDGRHAKKGIPTKPMPESERLKRVGHAALFCGGRIAQSFRELSLADLSKSWADDLDLETELAESLAAAQYVSAPAPAPDTSAAPALQPLRELAPAVEEEHRAALYLEDSTA